MKTNYNTLIVEDHAITAQGVENVLRILTETTGTRFKFYFATRCSEAIAILKREPLIDLVFLDIKLPKEPEIGMDSGKDLGVMIRKLYPNVQIIVLTAYNQSVMIDGIIDEFAPEGLLVKGDTTAEDLIYVIKIILRNPPYYSSTVVEIISNRPSSNVELDELDFQILTELEKGLTMVEIGKVVLLSSSAVAKRKIKLKVRFGVPDEKDWQLIDRARSLGYI